MARYPAAKWEPVTGHTNGPMRSYTGVVLHCNDAESYDLHDFFQRSAGDSAVSSHFQVAKDGTVWQYLDTSESSWCQKDGNDDYLSIESEGLAGELATAAQVAAVGGILAWAHATHGIPLQLAEIPGQRGFGWHGMGAANGYNWGHALCPGVRKDQRAAMLAAAATNPEGDDMSAAEVTAINAHTDAVVEHARLLLQGEVRNARSDIKTVIAGEQAALVQDISTIVAGGGDPAGIAVAVVELLKTRLAS